ncbi:MAG: hypothetical protein PHN49_09400 [Candidatus Omnitrophica bacterium]|nr:hypothetical protein [Candidatus Omnitrophota bacterium]MDD5671843.1 hypothetical protein [Candidatus Omnitrophota bacterium]
MILLALVIPATLGFLSTRFLLRKSPLPYSWLLSSVMAFPLGLGICSLVLFWSYVIANGFGRSLTLLVLIVLFIIAMGLQIKASWGRPSPISLHPGPVLGNIFNALNPKTNSRTSLFRNWAITLAALLFVYLFLHYTYYFIGKVVWNIYGGWDARYFWNLKAKFYFRVPAEWKGMFNPILDWAHPDYPLLLPGAVAWGWITAGKELLIWPPIVDYAFFCSLCFLVIWYLSAHVSWWNGLLAGCYLLTVHMFRFWSTTQYADIPLTFFFTSAAILLLLAIRSKDKHLFLFSGLLAGLSAWTKNEGLFFVLWLGLTGAAILLRSRSMTRQEKKSMILYFLGGLLVPLATVVFAKVVLGVKGGEYIGSGRNLSDYIRLLFFDAAKTKFIALCFLVFKSTYSQWQGLWILFLAGLLAGNRDRFKDYRWIFAVLIAGIELGYFVILHVSPNDPKLQVETSLMRLMMHGAALAMVFTFEAIGPLFRAQRKSDPVLSPG